MDVNHLKKPPPIRIAGDGDDDAEYVSSLSTIFLATIQEAKDRISQIEYIFCSQLYPHFQKATKCQQKLFAEAKRAADGECKEKESQLQLQIKQLCAEKDKVLEDCENLNLERIKVVRRMTELEDKLLHKSKEVEEGMELHNKLLHLLESKAGMIASKEKLLKEQEEKMNCLLSKTDGSDKRLYALEAELLEKNEEVAKGKDLQAQLLSQIESHASEKEMFKSNEEEKKQILVQLRDMSNRYDGLKEELQGKEREIKECRGREAKLSHQMNAKCLEVARKNQQLETQEREKSMYLSRICTLESKIEELQMKKCAIEEGSFKHFRQLGDKELAQKSRQLEAQEREKSLLLSGITEFEGRTGHYHRKLETSECCQNLVQQIELKTSELLSEKQKRMDMIAAYKSLKSQYNFLLTRSGLTTEKMCPRTITYSESGPSHHHTKSGSNDFINRSPSSKGNADMGVQVKDEIVSPENSSQTSTSDSSRRSKSRAAPKRGPPRSCDESSSAKRCAPKWRDTRSRASPGGHDPHDDFLDTPFENMRGNLKLEQDSKAFKEELPDDPAPASKDIACDSSDDETQEPGDGPGHQKRQSEAPTPGPQGFKYVEPVRKKSEREKLKGVECKQCKRFYDAVLPDGADDNKGKHRCEHVDVVSKHRYRYVPPLTPKGFWDIGFESEI